MSRYNVSILSAVVGIVFTTTGYTAVINVPDDIGTIQGGIDAAEDGDTVLVAPGEYRESINFLGKNIIVGSRYMTTGDWQFVAETVIRPQARGRVVTFANGETEEAEIVGFTLTGGRADTGGGIFCESANPCINACLITRNSGNGIRCSIAGPSISNCTISENNSAGGAGIDIQGQAANPVITDCEFLSNTAGFVGGGMHVGWGANATLTRCNFFDNTGGESEGPTGHAIGISRSSLTLINCTIGRQRIQADWIRNAISINRATINLINCILWREQGDDMISTWDENLTVKLTFLTPIWRVVAAQSTMWTIISTGVRVISTKIHALWTLATAIIA